jgi:hypothetical protein
MLKSTMPFMLVMPMLESAWTAHGAVVFVYATSWYTAHGVVFVHVTLHI